MLMMLGEFVDVLQTHAVVVTDDAWCTCRMGQKPEQLIQLLLGHRAKQLMLMMLGAIVAWAKPKQLMPMMLRAFGTRAADDDGQGDNAQCVCGMCKEQNS